MRQEASLTQLPFPLISADLIFPKCPCRTEGEGGFLPGAPSARGAGWTSPLTPTLEDGWKPGWGRGSRVPGAPTPPFIPRQDRVLNDGLVQI